MSQIRSVLVCRLCRTEPGDRLLDCGHGVCLTCLSKTPQIKCPTCGCTTTVSAKTRVKNYTIASLWDMFKELNTVEVYSRGGNNLRRRIFALPLENNEVETVIKTKTCWICNKNPSSYYCNTCHFFICEECSTKTHDKNLGHILFPYKFKEQCNKCGKMRSSFYLFKSKQYYCTKCIIKCLQSVEKPKDGATAVHTAIMEGIYPIGSVKARTVEIFNRIKSGEYSRRLAEARATVNKTRMLIRERAKEIMNDMKERKKYDIQLNSEVMDQNIQRVQHRVDNDNLHLKMLISQLVGILLRFDDINIEQDVSKEDALDVSEKRLELAKKRLGEVIGILNLSKEELNERLTNPNKVLETFKTLTITRLLEPAIKEARNSYENYKLYANFKGEPINNNNNKLNMLNNVVDKGAKVVPGVFGAFGSIFSTVIKSIIKSTDKIVDNFTQSNEKFLKSTLIVNTNCINYRNLCKSSLSVAKVKVERDKEISTIKPVSNLTDNSKLQNENENSTHLSNCVVLNRLPICFCDASYMRNVRNKNSNAEGVDFVDVATKKELSDLSKILCGSPMQSAPTSPISDSSKKSEANRTPCLFLGSALKNYSDFDYIINLDEIVTIPDQRKFVKETTSLVENMTVYQRKMLNILGVYDDINKELECNQGGVGSISSNTKPKLTLLKTSVNFSNVSNTFEKRIEDISSLAIADMPSMEISLISDIMYNNRYNGSIIPTGLVRGKEGDDSVDLCPLSDWMKHKSMCSYDLSKDIHVVYNSAKRNYSIIESYDYLLKPEEEKKGEEKHEDNGPEEETVEAEKPMNKPYPGISIVRFDKNKTINYFRFGAEEDIYDLCNLENTDGFLTSETVEAVVAKATSPSLGVPLSSRGITMSMVKTNLTELELLVVEGNLVFYDGKYYYVYCNRSIVKAYYVRKKVCGASTSTGFGSSRDNQVVGKITDEESFKALDILKRNSILAQQEISVFKANIISWWVFFTQLNAMMNNKEDFNSEHSDKNDDIETSQVVSSYIRRLREGKITYNKPEEIQKRFEYTRVALAKIIGIDPKVTDNINKILTTDGVKNEVSKVPSSHPQVPCLVERRPLLEGSYVDSTNVFVGACVTRGPDWKYGNQDIHNPVDGPNGTNIRPSVGIITRILSNWATVRWLNGYSNSYKIPESQNVGEHYLIFSDKYYYFDDNTKEESSKGEGKDVEKVEESGDKKNVDRVSGSETEKDFEGYDHLIFRMIPLKEKKGGSIVLEYKGTLIGNTWRFPNSSSIKTITLQSVTRNNCKIGLPVTAGREFVFSENFNIEKLKDIAGPNKDGTLASGFVIPYGVIVQKDIIQGGWVWVCWFSMEDVIAFEATGEISNIVKDTNPDNFIINCYPIEQISSLAVWPIPKKDEIQLEKFIYSILQVQDLGNVFTYRPLGNNSNTR